jgi:hypothetical protein
MARLSEAQQNRFLQWCDQRQLTLLIYHLGAAKLPAWARDAITPRKARYEQRFARIKRELFEVVEALDKAHVEFVMLKGLSHAPALTPDARLRAQGDIDLWLLGDSVFQAQDVLSGLGYVPLREAKSRHLAPMGKPNNWVWRGDMFDPEMPISVELHYELWSDDAEHIKIPGLEQFWERRKRRDFDGRIINVLADEDLMGFAALHLLLHVLHGELPFQRAWEIASFLHTHAKDERFWASWQSLHAPALRQIEAGVFYLVSRWFDCESTIAFQTDRRQLPEMVQSWLEGCYTDPIKREWKPNKSETWLHLGLIESPRGKAQVLFRRLFPTSLPTFFDRPSPSASIASRVLNSYKQIPLLANRIVRHAVTLIPTLLDGVKLLWSRL